MAKMAGASPKGKRAGRRDSRVRPQGKPGRDARAAGSGGKKKNAKGSLLPDQGKRENRLSMFLAVSVVLILLVVVGFNAMSLGRHLRSNKARAEEVRQEIRAEEQRALEIEEYRKYTETNSFIEEIAREKLGLVYEGEIVFKEEK